MHDITFRRRTQRSDTKVPSNAVSNDRLDQLIELVNDGSIADRLDEEDLDSALSELKRRRSSETKSPHEPYGYTYEVDGLSVDNLYTEQRDAILRAEEQRKAGAKIDIVALYDRPADETNGYTTAEVWRAALTLANNMCVQFNDRINDADGSAEACHALTEAAKAIRGWLEPAPAQLAEMMAEATGRSAQETGSPHT